LHAPVVPHVLAAWVVQLVSQQIVPEQLPLWHWLPAEHVDPFLSRLVVQVTTTEVMFAFATVPVPPPETTQDCETGPDGLPETLTVYAVPVGTPVGKVKLPFVNTTTVCAPSFSRTESPVARPLTVPPIVNVLGGGGVLSTQVT
jgi:hypothetical protein